MPLNPMNDLVPSRMGRHTNHPLGRFLLTLMDLHGSKIGGTNCTNCSSPTEGFEKGRHDLIVQSSSESTHGFVQGQCGRRRPFHHPHECLQYLKGLFKMTGGLDGKLLRSIQLQRCVEDGIGLVQ